MGAKRPLQFEQELVALIRRAKMKFETKAKEDLLSVLKNFTDLQPDYVSFTFPDKVVRWCLALQGTIPIYYKEQTYHIPVAMYFLDNHPYAGPYCYVRPTSSMRIRASQSVDATGRIYLPYLSEWQYPNYDTAGLLQVITMSFQDKCPVYSVAPFSENSQHPKPNSASAAPYPPYPTSDINQPYPTNLPYPTVDPPTHLMPKPNIPGTGYQPPYRPAPYPPSDPVISSQTDPSSYGYTSGTIQPQHIKASLLSAIEDKIKQRLQDKIGTPFAELQSIDFNLRELNNGKQQLKEILENITRDQQELDRVLGVYNEKKNQLEAALQSANSNGTTKGEPFNVEDVIDAQTPVHQQIMKCYAQDCAVDDTIYCLGQALKKGTTNLQTYLKLVRQLSLEQFQHRLLMQKCRDRARLPV